MEKINSQFKIDVVDPNQIDGVSVQLANKDAGRKISIPKTKAEYLELSVGDTLWIIKAEFNGRPALLVTKPRLS